MINPKDVTIIIPHLGNNPESEYALTQCITSLIESDFPEDNILVVKNGVNNCKHDQLADIKIRQQGQCKAVNAAVATINTPWILISNDDMIYPPGWFEKLTEGEYEEFEFCVSPKLVEPKPGAPTFLTYFCGGAGGDFDKAKWLEYAKKYYEEHPAVETSSGFNLPFLIKKELWDLVGGYDVNYDPWGSNSDSDLEYKIKLAGVQPTQRESCIIYHFSQTSGTFHPDNNEYYQRNFTYFKEKWGFDRTDEGIWEATFTIPTRQTGRLFNPVWEGKYGS